MPMMIGFGWWPIVPLFAMGLMAFLGWNIFVRMVGPGHKAPREELRPDPLAIARERFAKGLISQKEFDQTVERLLRTETRD